MLVSGLLLVPPLHAQTLSNGKPSKDASLEEKIMSCGELWEQIQASDCGTHIVDIFRGGRISLGIASYSLSVDPKLPDRSAHFSGDIYLTPYVSLNTRLTFIENTEFGYDFAIGFEQAHSINQTVTRNNGDKRVDLNTFAIANTFSSQASLFYSYGARDSTPHRYILFGAGFGIGYADVVGKSYMTEVDAETYPECHQAGVDFIDDTSTGLSELKNQCELKSFRRLGLGISGRINLDFRYDNFFLTIESQVIQLSSGKSLSFGTSDMGLNPGITAVTLSYVYTL